MQHAKNLGAGWRADLSRELKKLKYNPVDIAELDIAYSKEHTLALAGDIKRFASEDHFLKFKSNIRKHFIEADINLIRFDCDATIILYDESVRLGAGTTSEVHESFMHDIPVFLMNAYDKLTDVPGWMQAETTKIFSSWDSMLSYLRDLPTGILIRDIYGNRRSGNHYLCSLCGAVEEKHKSHYVSLIKPSYCKSCVAIVKETNENHYNRYQFFQEYLLRN